MADIKTQVRTDRAGNVVKVLATLTIEVPVQVELFEDGTYELARTYGGDDRRVIHVNADRAETLIEETHHTDVLQGVYEQALELRLDPDEEDEDFSEDAA